MLECPQFCSEAFLAGLSFAPKLSCHIRWPDTLHGSLQVQVLLSQAKGHRQQKGPRSLQNICIGFLGAHLEELVDDLDFLASFLPSEIKLSLLAIARRRGLLDDKVLSALADDTWEILDLSGSAISDDAFVAMLGTCSGLCAVDIRNCNKLTPAAVERLMVDCKSLHTLRCGGSAKSDACMRSSLKYFLPGLKKAEEPMASWEDLDWEEVVKGPQSLRWLIWPSINECSWLKLATECPRIVINPAPTSGNRYMGGKSHVPDSANVVIDLDEAFVKGIAPESWAVRGVIAAREEEEKGRWGEEGEQEGEEEGEGEEEDEDGESRATTRRLSSESKHRSAHVDRDQRVMGEQKARAPEQSLAELTIAEKFRLAYLERDERRAPKRAKNKRQNERRAARAWISTDLMARSRLMAHLARK
ncbi:hypothetical protein CBR_g34195 [Chara braunii]|uniref:Uncharacterized protein n=1 Tax=Chara braunii TaxID=69332 RepID=A0A388LIF3_CHABU|nr:hypothetical protein CBR_g34195 [Chara braunii]|eukprot:GBG82015.1 hypothetical protein CBR_g34195 [Chara braunii]